jgi:hypothetical protein
MCAVILAAGCSHKSSNIKPAYGFADTIAIDSNTLWRPEGAPDYRATAYIMDSVTPVYMIRGKLPPDRYGAEARRYSECSACLVLCSISMPGFIL